MATPTILIEQVGRPPGASGSSRDDLVVGQLVTLTDPANGAGTYAWTMLTRPTLSSAVLSGASTDTATFVPDVWGTYTFSLTFNGTDLSGYTDVVGQWISAQGGAGVKDPYGTRAPAAGETIQFGLQGWHPAREEAIHQTDRLIGALDQAEGSIFYADASGNLVPLAPTTSGYVLATQGVAAAPSWVLADSVGGNTLNASYNEGGAGSGRAITADAGAVAITNPNADAANVLELATTALGTGAALSIANPGAGAAISIDNGQVLADPSATGTLPSYAFLGADNYGMYYDSSETRLVAGGQVIAQLSISQIVLSTGGVEAMRLDASQDAHFSGAVYPDATDVNDLGSATLAWNTVYQNLVHLKEGTGPGFQAGWGSVWVKNDTANTLWFTDDTGAVFQIGGIGAGAGMVSLSVVDIDDPSLELNAIAGVSKGDTRLVYQTVVGTDSWTIYAWDDVDSGAENVPYTVDGSSGMWSAIGGKYTASIITLRNGSSSNMSLNFAGSPSTGFYKGVGSSIMANAGGSGSARFLPNQLAATAVGSAATPSITQNNNLTTGAFFSSGSLGFTTSGVEALLLSATQDASFAGNVTLGLGQNLVLDNDGDTYIYATSDDTLLMVAGTNNKIEINNVVVAILQATLVGIAGVGVSEAIGLSVGTSDAATVGAQQYSGMFIQAASGWKTDATAAAQTVQFAQQVLTTQGTAAPTGTLVLKHNIDGGAYTEVQRWTTDTTGSPVSTIARDAVADNTMGNDFRYAGLALVNTTAAVTGTGGGDNQQYSPALLWEGQVFKSDATSGSKFIRFSAQVEALEGPNVGRGSLVFRAQVEDVASDAFQHALGLRVNANLNFFDLDAGIDYTTAQLWLGSGDVRVAGTGNDLKLYGGSTESGRFDDDATAGNTRFMLYDVDNATLERVTVGATDSGGSGYKVLRIPN